jgi:citrate lyase subunit beta/citryl-CoA lyase
MPGPRLRSVLYVPGANGRALEKARELPADALIFDLEDAVAPEAKQRARDCACEAARSGAYTGRTVAIRINAIATPWHDEDLIAVAAAAPDAVVVPKIGSAQDIETVEQALQRCSAPTSMRLWAMLETPAAVLRSAEIAAAGERLSVLVMGTNDLLAELRAEEVPDRRPLELSLMMCLLAARAAERTILDGVYNDVGDPVGLKAECAAGRRLGFDGKTLIHPGQIEVCNRVFSASAAEFEHARRVIAAFEQAAQAGSGVATLDGRLIEHLHVESALRTLGVQQNAEDEGSRQQPARPMHASRVKLD